MPNPRSVNDQPVISVDDAFVTSTYALAGRLLARLLGAITRGRACRLASFELRPTSASRAADASRAHKAAEEARERIEVLVDKGSFNEMDRLVVHQSVDFGMTSSASPATGVVTGSARIHGRPVFVFARTSRSGRLALGGYARKICKIMDLAMKTGTPMSGSTTGGRASRRAWSRWPATRHLPAQYLASGVVPRSRPSWAVRGRRGLLAAITDFVFMVKNSSYMS